jgi:hypothetical protein
MLDARFESTINQRLPGAEKRTGRYKVKSGRSKQRPYQFKT